MADPDDEAIANLRRNEGKPKCNQCNGTGYVMKYVLPKVTDLVKCLGCGGTGLEPPADETYCNTCKWPERFCKCTS